MLYARDNSGRLAPAKTWGFYFFSTTHRNLGAYYLSEHAADKKLLFCPSAPTGFINYDPGHHGFGLEDHRPFWDGPNSIFTGSYRAGSYQTRAVSAQYDISLPNDPKTSNWKHNQNVPSYEENDDLNQSVKILRADSHTALVTDVFGLARGYAGQQYFTIGHDFVYNTLYGDGSATGVDCREAPFILLQQNPHFGHLEFLDIFDR